MSRREAMAAALLLPVLGLLSACGKKGSPRPPPGADPAFPRRYPDPRTVLPQREEERGGTSTGSS